MRTWLVAAGLAGCPFEPEEAACLAVGARPAGWDEARQGPDGAPDHGAVFAPDRVGTLALRMDAADYEHLYEQAAAGLGSPFGAPAPLDQPRPDFDPVYVPVDVTADGTTWCSAGLRLKGNSSLIGAWMAGIEKLPFRLDFDRYEDARPELRDQRFFGFEELGFANGFGDPTLLRDVLASEILEDRGVPVARSAWWWVTLDRGEGIETLGLYTAIEAVDDTVVERIFGDDGGTLYEADGPCATLSCYDTASFDGDGADGADVAALHAALASTAPDWRLQLESALDLPAFLRWLAVNTALRNGDTYGGAPHNYFLHGIPAEGGRLAWIPRDHNECLSDLAFGSFDPLLADVGADWPLIRRVLDEPDYADVYRSELRHALEGAYAKDAFEARVGTLAALLEDELHGSGPGERPGETFLGSAEELRAAVDGLVAYAAAWRERVEASIGAD